MQDTIDNKMRLREMIVRTIQEEGVKGLYTGIKFDLIRVLPSNTIMFVVYEYLRKSAYTRNFYLY